MRIKAYDRYDKKWIYIDLKDNKKDNKSELNKIKNSHRFSEHPIFEVVGIDKYNYN